MSEAASLFVAAVTVLPALAMVAWSQLAMQQTESELSAQLAGGASIAA